MSGLVSIVIPNLNKKDLLDSCLRSLAAQGYPDIETIVVDNGSTDGAPEMVMAGFPRARVIRFSENRGFSAAVNAGIEAASGELVALINNDADADPKWVSELVAAAERHPEAGFFASKILFYDDRKIIDTFGDSFSKAGFGFKIGWGEEDGAKYGEEAFVLGACGGAALYRKAMLEDIKVGGEYFDNDFFAFGEDLDLSLRAQLKGYRCVAVPSAKVYHRVRATAGRKSQLPIFLGHRNFIFCILKDFPGPVIMKNLPSIFTYLLFSLAWDILFKRKLSILKSYIDVLKKRKIILRKRSAIMAGQKVSDSEFNGILSGRWFFTWLRLGRSSHLIRKRAI